MLKTAFLSVFGVVGLLAGLTSAQEVGDNIVVTADKAPLRSRNDTIGAAPRAAVLVVENVNGDWFWVTYSDKAGTAKGWINRSDVIPFSQALDFYNEELRRNPADGRALARRGMIWDEKGEHDSAISDYNEAIHIDPKMSDAFYGRGSAWEQKGDYDKAISDYKEAIRLNPKNARIYFGLGNVSLVQGEYDKAVTNLNEAIRLDPKYADALNGRAWLAATCPDVKYRNGRKAVDDATKAYELNGRKLPNDLDTLGAAYAEAGEFETAVKWQEQALERAPEAKKAAYQSRLDLYKARQPYHEDANR